jgi:AhpD family alkylhydroperoxidase
MVINISVVSEGLAKMKGRQKLSVARQVDRMPIVRSVVSRAGALKEKVRRRKPPRSPFGGFKKRTITAAQLARRIASLVPEFGTMYRVWLKQEIDPGFREELMLVVSQLNGCRFCSWGHHEWAQISGVPDEELARLEQLDPSGFDRRKWLAISYVRALVKEDFKRVQPGLRRAMQHKYSPEEIRQIELIAKVMDVGNRGSNTFDAMLSRLKGVPAADSRIIDEVILSGAFLAIAPMVVFHLSRTAQRPFLEMARSLVDYTKNYEDKIAKPGASK